jgi:hypothetical protein
MVPHFPALLAPDISPIVYHGSFEPFALFWWYYLLPTSLTDESPEVWAVIQSVFLRGVFHGSPHIPR